LFEKEKKQLIKAYLFDLSKKKEAYLFA